MFRNNTRSQVDVMSEESWERVQSLLKENLSKSSYETWIRPIQFLSFKNGELTLFAQDKISSISLKMYLSQRIKETAEKVFGEPVTLNIRVEGESTDKKGRLLDEEYSSKFGESLRSRMILSDPMELDWSKETMQKRIEAEKLKGKQTRQKIRRYLYVALIIIGAILIILRG